MRTLVLSPRQAWPPTSGAKLREYHLARALGRVGDLTWVFYANPDEAAPKAGDLPFCSKLVPVERPQLYSAGRIAKGLMGRWSLPVVNYTSPRMIETIRGILRENTFDLIHVDIIHMAGCLEAAVGEARGAKVFFNWHNIESELMRRYSEGKSSALRRLYAKVTAGRLERDEARILSTADGHVVCSERERAILSAKAPGRRVAVIENGVDAGAYSEIAGMEKGPRPRLVFVGSMAYHANIDAALWFVEEIWPRLRQRFPQWTLTLVGSDPGPEVRALGERPGVEVTGTVPDVRPYYREAAAAIVPIRIAAGTRLKILEAMAAGVPVVSTPVGAEGLPVCSGKDILLAERPEEWEAALASLDDQDRVRGLTEAGLEMVRSHYDWEVLERKLAATYQEWLKA